MKGFPLLFQMLLMNRRHFYLLLWSLLASILLTFSSQLEMAFVAIMARSGPDFFLLMGEEKGDRLVKRGAVDHSLYEQRWQELDKQGKGTIDNGDVRRYLQQKNSSDRVSEMVDLFESYFSIDHDLLAFVTFIFAVALLKAVALFSYRYSTRLAAIRVSRDLRQRYFEHLQKMSMTFFQEKNVGALSTRAVQDANMIAEALTALLTNYLQTPFLIVSTLILCFWTSWHLSCLIFIGLPLLLAPIILIAKKVKKIARDIQRNQEHFASALVDFLSGIVTIKSFNMEEFALEKYRKKNHEMAFLEQKSARYDLSSRPISHTIGILSLSAVMIYGQKVLLMSVAEIFLYGGLLTLFYEPIKKFAEENHHIQRGIVAAERLNELLTLPPIDVRKGEPLSSHPQWIETDKLLFRYPNSSFDSLQGVNLRIERGALVAIVGPSGAGKSTLIQLLLRLYEPTQGKITIDGKSIDRFSLFSLRESIAYVPQRPFLFMDTVRANIAFGRDYSLEEVRKAAKRAHAEEFILQLPQGYDTLLQEGGGNLSGGERQRIAIARALVKQAPIILFDEATSSLDPIRERGISDTLLQLRGSVTQIVIAHRLTTLKDCDCIFYMEKGNVIAQGTFEELLHSTPAFYEMWSSHEEEREVSLV